MAVDDVARFFEKVEPNAVQPTTPLADSFETQVEKDVAAYFADDEPFDQDERRRW